MNYKEYNDEELLSYIKEQNEDANELMFAKYKPLIKSLATRHYPKFRNKGLELSDLIQEGMIGLSYAITSYKEEKEATFYTYAKTCIERRIISVLVGQNRLKNKILNESIPIEVEDEEISIIDIIKDDSINPEKMVMNYEQEKEIYNLAKEILTDRELQVFELKMAGFDYREIADTLDVEPKSVDNAIQRIKMKFKKNKE